MRLRTRMHVNTIILNVIGVGELRLSSARNVTAIRLSGRRCNWRMRVRLSPRASPFRRNQYVEDASSLNARRFYEFTCH